MQHEIPTPSQLIELIQDTEQTEKHYPGLKVVMDMPAYQLKWILEVALAASIKLNQDSDGPVNITDTD